MPSSCCGNGGVCAATTTACGCVAIIWMGQGVHVATSRSPLWPHWLQYDDEQVRLGLLAAVSAFLYMCCLQVLQKHSRCTACPAGCYGVYMLLFPRAACVAALHHHIVTSSSCVIVPSVNLRQLSSVTVTVCNASSVLLAACNHANTCVSSVAQIGDRSFGVLHGQRSFHSLQGEAGYIASHWAAVPVTCDECLSAGY
jgi:hypothetical protein